MNLNLWYLQVFVRVYECMSMSVAAEALFITQPAVSRIIRELEDIYGIRFFIRQSGKLYRTEGGQRFYPHARFVLEAAEQLEHAIRDQKLQRKVHVGATPTVGSYYLPAALRRYLEVNGELDIYVQTGPASKLENMLKDAQLDFAIMEEMRPSQELTVYPLIEDRMVFIGGLQVPVPDPMPLLILDLGERNRQRLEQDLYQAGISYVIKGLFADVEGIKKHVACGLGVGIIPAGTIQPGEAFRQMEIPQVSPARSLSLVYHRKKFLFPQLLQLISILEEEFNELQKRESIL